MKLDYIQHGNCMELMNTIPDAGVDFVLTDIPYGAVSRNSNGLRNLDKNFADVETFEVNAFLSEAYRVSSNSLCIFCGKEQFSEIYRFFAELPGTVRPVVWRKTNPSPMNGQHVYLSGVELAVWFKKRGGGGTFNAHCKNTVFDHPCGSRKYHPTQKNLKLFEELILDNTNPGDVVLDPCIGSGTTAIAACLHGRHYIGFDLDSRSCDIAAERVREIAGAAQTYKQ